MTLNKSNRRIIHHACTSTYYYKSTHQIWSASFHSCFMCMSSILCGWMCVCFFNPATGCYITILAAYPADGGLLLAPAALGGARSIRYTARLKIATVVPRALARCRLSKSHHRPSRVFCAASAVDRCHFSTAWLSRNRRFCTVFRIFTH